MGFWGLGKKRTKFGAWVDQEGLSQEEVASICSIGRNTVSRMCNDPKYKPTLATVTKITTKMKSNGRNMPPNLFA